VPAARIFSNHANILPPPPAATLALKQLIVEAREAFGGYWPRAEPWLGQSEVLRSVFCEHELHKLTIFVTQIPADRKLLLPSITFVSSEFGLLNYAGYWKICMDM
jgi:hypothetical protein